MISDDPTSTKEAQTGTTPGAPEYGEHGGYGRGTYGAMKPAVPSDTPTTETSEGKPR